MDQEAPNDHTGFLIFRGAVHLIPDSQCVGCVCWGGGCMGVHRPGAKELLAGPDLSLRGCLSLGRAHPAPVALTCGGRGLREAMWVSRGSGCLTGGG